MSKYQELILWVGVGVVVVFLLTNSDVKSLLFEGGNKGTSSSSNSSTTPVSPTTNKSGQTTCPPGYTYVNGKCQPPEAM